MEIKDVKLPVQLQRAMAAEAEATREARAKVGTLNMTHTFACLHCCTSTYCTTKYLTVLKRENMHYFQVFTLRLVIVCYPDNVFLLHLKVIAAEGEMNASRALKEASLVIAESPSALQLRYLQTLNTIAAEKNSTIIFPLPMDVMSHFMHK